MVHEVCLMIDVCPTITTASPEEYHAYMKRLSSFARRVHIDLADGSLTTNTLISPENVWWPAGMRADIHLMDRRPFVHIHALTALNPQLVIVQAEAEGDFAVFAETMHRHGIEAGVALLPSTAVDSLRPALELIDHVLIFSGNLGSYGGLADLRLLTKAAELKKLKPSLELSFDGGINDTNAAELVSGGIEVLNVGGFIAHAADPEAAWRRLVNLTVGVGR